MSPVEQYKHKFTPIIKKEAIFQRRVMAFTIDLFFIVVCTKLMVFSYTLFLQKFSYPIYHGLRDSLPYLMEYLEAVTILIFYGSYFFLSLYLSQGKTIGKTVMGLKVISHENPGEIYWWQALSRTIGYYAGYMSGLILFALPLTNKRRLGVQDWISTTQNITDHQWDEMQKLALEVSKQSDQRSRTLELLINGQELDEAA